MVNFDMLQACDSALHVSFVAEGSERLAGSLAVASFAANEKFTKSITDKTIAMRVIDRPIRRPAICTPQVQTSGAPSTRSPSEALHLPPRVISQVNVVLCPTGPPFNIRHHL